MLKFLEGKQYNHFSPRTIKYQPAFCYGNSYQSPQQSVTPHTILYKSSYINPFIPSSSLKPMDKPLWTRKTSLLHKQEQKILGNNDEKQQLINSQYLKSYQQQIQNKTDRFHLTKGQFTTFIQKNHHNKSLGPLLGKQRDYSRIINRKKSVWIKIPSKRQQMTTSLRYASSLNTTVRSSIATNSSLITDKIRIRSNRVRAYARFQNQLECRKKDQTNKFGLLTSRYKNESTFFNTKNNNQQQTNISDQMDIFDQRLSKKFK